MKKFSPDVTETSSLSDDIDVNTSTKYYIHCYRVYINIV